MPFSMEEQLKLLGPTLFEELCAQMIKTDHPQSSHIEGAGGDEGIDIFEGELDKKRRSESGSKLRIWQVKFFREIKSSQIKKIKDSLAQAIKKHQPEHWTLCLPINLNIHRQKWFEEIENEYPDVDIDLWQADTIIAKIPEKLIDSYFLRHQTVPEEKLNSILERLNDFQSVPQLLKENQGIEIEAGDFYNGSIPTWADITHDFDAQREEFGKLWKFIAEHINNPGGRNPFALITGRSGDGKSTLLMRLAAELSNQTSNLVFFCKNDVDQLRVDQLSELPGDQVSFVLIDRIGRVDNLRGFFERLYCEHIPVVVIGAEIRSLWDGIDIALDDCCDIIEIQLERLTNHDIESLLDKLSVKPEYLGALASLSREKQLEIFQQKASRQLLVALLEAKHNQPLKTHIKNELQKLHSRFKNRDILSACYYVSAMHRLDLSLSREILKALLPNLHIDDHLLRYTHGLMTELKSGRQGLVTRHALIADVIFEQKQSPARCYKEIINATQDGYAYLIARLLHTLHLLGENYLDELFSIAANRFPFEACFSQMHAILAKEQGDIPKARRLFEKASQVDPKNAPVWQAWALLEKEQGDIPKARWLFEKASKADPKDAPVWQAWALLEKEQGDIPKARRLFEKASKAGPKHAPVWQAWALLEKEQGDIPKARRLFEKASQVDPKNAPAWQEWAIMEFEQNNIGNFETEYSGRWLFLKAIDANSDDVVVWQAWAVKEFEQNNIGTFKTKYSARWLFQKASRVDPQNVHVWQGWATLEKKLGRWPHAEAYFLEAAKNAKNPEDRGRIYFDLAMMFGRINDQNKAEQYFLKAVEANPDDAITHARLAKLYGFQNRWEESEKHFKNALELKPNDQITKKWYENMKAVRDRYQARKKNSKQD